MSQMVKSEKVKKSRDQSLLEWKILINESKSRNFKKSKYNSQKIKESKVKKSQKDILTSDGEHNDDKIDNIPHVKIEILPEGDNLQENLDHKQACEEYISVT